MILLDTNVISEPWRPVPDEAVIDWLDAQAIETLFLTALVIAELRFGITAMPSGKRQAILRDRLKGDVLPHFSERILTFDLATSQSYSELMARARTSGKLSARLMAMLQPQRQRTASRLQLGTRALSRLLG
jgi:toxin FitB